MTPTRSMFDLSHNNPLPTSTYAGDIPLFGQAKGAGWVAMMHKLTQGQGFVDPVALGRIGAANTAGLLLGGYHYMDTTPVAGQVANFMHVAGLAKAISANFVLCLDFEPGDASDDSTAMANEFVTAVQAATGTWPLLYTGRWDVAPNVTGTNLPACPLWLAEYGTNPVPPPGWINWMFHQYSDGSVGPNPANIPGIGSVDQSEYPGSIEELSTWWTG
jgi:lysozyme